MFSRLLVLVLAASSSMAHSACPPVTLESPQYAKATRIVQQLPEFKEWQRYVAEHPPSKIILGVESFVKSVPIEGRCFVSVSIYSDEETHLHRWNTFYVSLQSRRILVQDLEGEAVSLRAWRRSNRSIDTDAQRRSAAPLHSPPVAGHLQR
jgi:hypothetical protein